MKIIPMQIAAYAKIRGGDRNPCIRGIVRLYQLPGGVLIEADVSGLPNSCPGFLGFHIHEGGSCSGKQFADTKGHFNPTEDAHPMHAGDLPPLLCAGGKAYLSVLTDRFCIRDVLGKTVVIHGMPDDFHTQPAGDSGEKIACGEIVSAKGCFPREDICHRRVEKG
ncbi:MAG: superoxide dismutase family protein [Faecousia sp.]